MLRLLSSLALLAAVPIGNASAVNVGGTEPPEQLLALPDGLTVGVEFPRYLMVQRRLEAIIDNQSDIDVVVVDVALRSPLFEPVEADVHDYRVAAGLRQDLRMDVGASICPPPDGPSMIEMTVEIDGQRSHGLVEIDIDPITTINTRECGEQFVFEHADVEWGPGFAVDDGLLTTTVTLTRRDGAEAMSVSAVRGTVLYIVVPSTDLADDEPLGTMAAGESTGIAPVVMYVGRCEPHAIGDVKKPYSFNVWVTIGDSDPYPIELLPGEEIQAALAELLQECITADDA